MHSPHTVDFLLGSDLTQLIPDPNREPNFRPPTSTLVLSRAGSVDCCKILLDAKANPMLADRSGGSALQIASEPQDGKTNPCLPDLLIAANAPEHWVASARAAINAGVPIPEELPADDTVLLRRQPSAPSSEPEHDDPAVDALRLAAMGLDLN